jgi:ABC-type uncharacterized transport system permease subunit
MDQTLLIAAIASAISGSTAILLAATGELLVEKVGVYNIALEGVMLVGALTAFMVDVNTGSWLRGRSLRWCSALSRSSSART